MTLPVLVEPIAKGFRASMGSPFLLSVEADSADEALKGVESQVDHRLQAGAEVRSITIDRLKQLAETASRLRANPLFEAAQKEIRAFRETYNTVPVE